MSKMTEAMDRIAIYAEQNNYTSLQQGYIHFVYAYGDCKNIILENLSLEELESIPLKIKPRFSEREIDELVKDYSFKLPVEVYQLYQRGNGLNLPIGLDRNYDSFTNYFRYPGDFTTWFPLEEAIDWYRGDLSYGRDIGQLDSNLFPMFSNEMCTYAVKGNVKQQETSPLFAIDEGLNVYRVCSSVTNLMLAYMETIENSDSDGRRDLSQIDVVADKYQISHPELLA